MPNPLQKSLHGYLSKIKRETGKLQLSSSNSFSSSKNWVLGKHPKKLSFSFNKHRRRNSKSRFNKDDNVNQDPGRAATLSDIDRFLEENFKSLCIRDEEEGDQMTKMKGKRLSSEESDDDDDYRHRFERTWGPAVYDSPKLPDLRRRERLSPRPGSSEGRPSMDTTSTSEERQSRSTLVLPENCIAVLRYTAEPQEDFRRSMVEMIESKLGVRESEVDWDLMEELLFCYLDLNDKKSHRFILSAFVDLIIALRDKEKRITRKGIERSLSTRAARDRLRKRMIMTDAFRN
ncbi:Transcription repressor OFP14 [Cardamine amara subsp. amara]|uniref:Transcription repressor n=1 Tax=Cardamine amara subsp. amara TaxID=228776 RepID=A0ABD0ZXU3_CARAN